MAAGKPRIDVCCERGCASESNLSSKEVVQLVMSILYLFSFPSGNTTGRYSSQMANGQVCSSLVGPLTMSGGSSSSDFQDTDHSGV